VIQTSILNIKNHPFVENFDLCKSKFKRIVSNHKALYFRFRIYEGCDELNKI